MNPNASSLFADDHPSPPDRGSSIARSSQVFDDLTVLAAHVCQVPFADILLAAGERHWCAARAGWRAGEIPPDNEFHTFSVGLKEMLMVHDTRLDARFALNPLVIGPPHLRFYASVPLLGADGQWLGCLSVADVKPRKLSPALTENLRRCAAQMVVQLELIRVTRERDETLNQLRCLRAELTGQAAVHAEDLRRAHDESQVFCHLVTHELGSSLRAIQAFAELLQSAPGVLATRESAGHLQSISRACCDLLPLLNRLLHLACYQQQPLDKRRINPADLLEEIIEQYRAAGHRTEWRIGPLLPCQADRLLLRQVFLNLVNNALKFTGLRPAPVIEVSSVESDEGVTYTVRDNGVGFEPSQAGLLFQPFQRLHSRAEFDGVGLGLALAKKIIEKHGGSIWAEAVPGQGAAFHFNLPRA